LGEVCPFFILKKKIQQNAKASKEQSTAKAAKTNQSSRVLSKYPKENPLIAVKVLTITPFYGIM